MVELLVGIVLGVTGCVFLDKSGMMAKAKETIAELKDKVSGSSGSDSSDSTPPTPPAV